MLSRRGQRILDSQRLHLQIDRIIGFQQVRKARPYPEWQREAMIGPLRERTPPNKLHVSVAFLEAPKQIKLKLADPYDRKCKRIWCSTVRNDRLASIVSAISNGQLWKLEKYEINPEAIQHLNHPICRLVILVESLIHAQELHRRLPGWPILGLDTSSSPAPCQTGYIVTVTYAATHGLEADVIILATGGVDSLPRSWLRSPDADTGRENHVIIIDLADHTPVVMGRQTHTRRLLHQQQGYQVLDCTRTEPQNERRSDAMNQQ